MKPIFAIDPGSERSACIRYWPGSPIQEMSVRRYGWLTAEEVINLLKHAGGLSECHGTIECIQGYHRNIGSEIIATIEAAAVFRHVWKQQSGNEMARLTRPQVAAHLTRSAHATKSNVRAALYEKFGPGRKLAVGSKKERGPLYGMTIHELDALAVAVTWHEQNQAAK